MNTRWVVVAVVGLVALAGCSSTGSVTAARPKTIAMTDVDPCQVLAPEQLSQLGVQTTPARVDPSSAGNRNSPSCLWNSPPRVDFSKPSWSVFAQAVTYLGVDDVFKRVTTAKAWITVQGFRAVQEDNPEGPSDPNYQVWVDVGDGQSLNIACTINDWNGTEQAGKDEARDKATQAADLAVTTLLAR